MPSYFFAPEATLPIATQGNATPLPINIVGHSSRIIHFLA
jgi:hypothetical protein